MNARQKKLIEYNKIITQNKKLFKTGSKISRFKFASIFKVKGIRGKRTPQEYMSASLELVKTQTLANVLMRENGLYIRSKNYYSSFEVAELPKTKNTVVRYSAEVEINSVCTKRLETKLTERENEGTWGYYRSVPKNQILRMTGRASSPRHEGVCQRMYSEE